MDDYTQQLNNGGDDKKKLIIKISIIVLAAFVIISSLIIGYRYFKGKSTGQSGDGSLFPSVGDMVNIITGKEETSTTTPIVSADKKLLELYKGPVGGYILLGDNTTARLFDRAKGLIVDVNINSGEQKIVTDQPILHVHDVTFVNDLSMITRSLEDNTIKSNMYSFSQNNSTGILEMEGVPTTLADNILELAKSRNNKHVAFVIKDTTGSNIDLLNVENNSLKRQISLPITEWIPFVTNDGEVILSSKASKFADSGAYKIVDNALNKVIESKKAQTITIAPNGKRAFSFPNYEGNMEPNLYTIVDDGNYVSTDNDSEFATIADKCAWNIFDTIIICGNPNTISRDMPDDWYLGQTSYFDAIYKYNTVTNKSEMLTNPASSGINIDIINPEIKDNIFLFKNKLDEHLFVYKLDENVDLEVSETETPEAETNEQ